MFRIISTVLICGLYLLGSPVFAGTLVVNEAKLTASDAASNDNFGDSVAVSGDTAVVGASQNSDAGLGSGSAYVFVRAANGTWSEQQKLSASDAAASARFGRSVAIDGDTIVVGASGGTGGAYVFVRSGTTWTEQQKLTVDSPESVAIDGDTAVVGSGESAFVFVRSGTTWTEEQILTASDAAGGENFGESVSVSGDTVVVGAHFDDDAGLLSGSAYVFVRSGTTWTEEQKLTASDAAAVEMFGGSVSVSGVTAVVGALKNTDGTSRSGSAYVFERSETTWTQQKQLKASDSFKDDFFGDSVAIDGDTVVVGARNNGDAGLLSGSAYLYVRSGSSWSQLKKITASDAAERDTFGSSVAISGNTVVAGARGNDDAGSNSGSAYVFKLVPNFFQATLLGTRFCNDGLGGAVKEIRGQFYAPFNMNEVVFPMTGIALLKNPKSGVLQLFGNDSSDFTELAMSGNIKFDKKTGGWSSLKGKIQLKQRFFAATGTCTLAGKFKGK
jgi:hypothetical protein